ncbi:hypothetical protein LINPERHAP1_LOCUS7965 [Linum perenne]
MVDLPPPLAPTNASVFEDGMTKLMELERRQCPLDVDRVSSLAAWENQNRNNKDNEWTDVQQNDESSDAKKAELAVEDYRSVMETESFPITKLGIQPPPVVAFAILILHLEINRWCLVVMGWTFSKRETLGILTL